MKLTSIVRAVVRLPLLGCLVGAVLAQDGSFALLNKHIHATQTGTATTQVAATGAYAFEATIDGTATTPSTPISVTLPGGGTARALAYVASDQKWSYGQTFDTAAALLAAFPNGTYSYAFGGKTISMPFNGDLYPAVPVATASTGTWAGGTLTVTRSQPLSLTINFPQNYLAGASRLAVRVSGPQQADIEVENSASNFTDRQLTLTIPANTLVAGRVYEVELEANRIVTIDATSVPGYTVVAIYSVTTTFSLTTAGPPVFQQQPQSQEISNNSTVVFSAAAPNATGFQWLKNGAPINGATTPRLVIFGATAADAGAYALRATNAFDSATSVAANLRIAVGNDFGRLGNLSILTDLTATSTDFTLGTVIGGTGTTGDKPVVIRAVGPSLVDFKVVNPLSDPNLELIDGQTVISSNNDWAGAPALTTAFNQVGAFPYVAATSLDAAIATNLSARPYTVRVSGAAGARGRVLAEIYDATPVTSFRPATPRLVNVSVRKQIDAGGSLTTGFVISGSTAKTVLVRAIGPGLIQFGVPGVMVDPRLELFNGSSVAIAFNDNWGGDPQITAAGDRVGAFQIKDAQSTDAMLLLTLAPGSYSAEVRGVTGGGTALVEVYEVP